MFDEYNCHLKRKKKLNLLTLKGLVPKRKIKETNPWEKEMVD